MRQVLLVIPDLIFHTRVADTVRALGGTTIDVTAETVRDYAASADLLVVDAAPQSGGLTVAQTIKNDPTLAALPVLAFGSHVDVTAQRAAVAAGCDRIVTRGKFTAELPSLLVATSRTSEGLRTED